MRILALIGVTAFAVGCVMQPTLTPREYLDEQTAATITVVAEPWVFSREGTEPQLDFINLYAIDVNRMGDHHMYLVVAHYWRDRSVQGLRPVLEVHTGEKSFSFRAIDTAPREIGVGQTIDPKAPRSAGYWFYPIDAASLTAVAGNKHLTVALVLGDQRVPYIVWRDGSAELGEFATFALD